MTTVVEKNLQALIAAYRNKSGSLFLVRGSQSLPIAGLHIPGDGDIFVINADRSETLVQDTDIVELRT